MHKFSNFITMRFLNEQLDTDKLKHLEHVEDHPIHAGEEGYHHAAATLHAVHDTLHGKKHDGLKVTTKYDGSPSVVFGHHPESGKFFVATKSAFNASPKINYSHADIEANHGHAPGLVSKLKSAMDHLPKVTPKKGVYQGDIMHTPEDVATHGGSHHFKPNTITYSAPVNSKEGRAAKASKLGIVVHTKYNGPSFESMKAGFHVDHNNFGNHSDVHNISPDIKSSGHHITPEQSSNFNKHMDAAAATHEKLKGDGYAAVGAHQLHVKTYINDTIRKSTSPSTEGYKSFLKDRGEKEASKVKSEPAKAAKIKTYADLHGHVEANKDHFDSAFKIHDHVQKAKNQLVNALSHSSDFHHTVDGAPTKPEGFVATHNGRPSKLVDRHEFSRLNFMRGR